MKLLLTLCMLAASLTSYSATFFATDSLQTESRNYQLKRTLSVKALKYSPFTSQAVLKVNGKKLVKNVRVTTADFSNLKGRVELFKDVLLDGSGCDEHETVTYYANVSVKSSRNTKMIINSVVAEYKYSYDLCHDLRPETKTIRYSRQ